MHAQNLPADELGGRLRLAREAANLTQVAVAQALDIARTTLVAIEQGQRRVSLEELQAFGKLYGTNANALLRRGAIHVDLVPRFRTTPHVQGDAIQVASRLLASLAKAEVELENLLGVQRATNYPPERPLMPGNAVMQAAQDALELRQRVGLGLQPVLDISAFLEFELGVRLYLRRLDGQVSGLFAFDDRLGACMLLNANHPRERRNLTAAHELGHLVSTRRDVDVLHAQSPARSPEEQYANAFARSFLMPSRMVLAKLQEVTLGASVLTRRHVIVLAHTFGVSREAMVRRLEELGQTKPGTWEWFKANGGITDEQARQVLGDRALTDGESIDARPATTLRLSALAAETWRRKLLSEGQLARLLSLERVELREMLDDLATEGEAADGAPVLLR